jgi:hydroxymethylbilane synthase
VAIEASKNLPKSLREHIRSAVNDPETETCLVAERAFLATLNGGCSIPAFCFAELKNGKIHLRGGLVSLDGKKEIVVERNCELHLGAETGIAVAGEILSTGGKELLTEIRERQKQ